MEDLGGAHDAEVFFEWGEHGGPLSNATPRQTVSKAGPFSAEIDGLLCETGYDFRAVAEDNDDGDRDYGATKTFQTLSDDEHIR